MMPGRVLLVEDSPMISGALKVLLEASGYEVTLAETAAQAADWPHEAPADVMLLDITLPDGDGLAVVPALEARGLRPLATWAMTGHGDPETRDRCIAAGCNGVLLKPVPIQQLLRVVSQASA